MLSGKRIALALLGLFAAFFACALLFVDFRVARSSNNVNASTQATNAFQQDIDPNRITAATHRLFLHVPKRIGFNEMLAWEVRRALQATNRFEVTLVNGSPEADDYPLLLVDADVQTFQWYALYGKCAGNIKFGYAGDTTHIDVTPPAQTSLNTDGAPDGFQLRVYGTIEVQDSTVGLVSLPSYRRALVKEPSKDIAETIVKAIDELVAKAAKPN